MKGGEILKKHGQSGKPLDSKIATKNCLLSQYGSREEGERQRIERGRYLLGSIYIECLILTVNVSSLFLFFFQKYLPSYSFPDQTSWQDRHWYSMEIIPHRTKCSMNV